VFQGTYVSGDACERAVAFRLGYRTVCHHPKEIGTLQPDEVLVIDFDRVLFDDKDLALVKANEAANRGVTVGIHTYYPDDPRLEPLLALPNVVVAKTHRLVLAGLCERARSKDRARPGGGNGQPPKESEVTHVRTDPDKAGDGRRPGAPSGSPNPDRHNPDRVPAVGGTGRPTPAA
jgi:hypothetical protein